MKIIGRSGFILALVILFAGCAANGFTDANERKQYGALVEHSSTFKQARRLGGARAIWFVDGSEEAPIIYVGFDMGTHTVRYAYLRIREKVVERGDLDEDGKTVIWREDR